MQYTIMIYTNSFRIMHHVNAKSAEIIKVLQLHFDTGPHFKTEPQEQVIKQDPS